MTSVPTSFAPGAVLARKYRIDRVLGRGGMAVVLAATHLQLREPVAIKVLHRQVLTHPGALDRFLREARVTMRLRSEHVTRILDIETDEEGTPFIVMELLRGADFASVLRDEGAFSVSDAVDHLLQACEALVEAHAAGVVHRDLKPANLFLCESVDGRPLVKVLDFGVSKLLQEDVPDGLALTAPATASDHERPSGPAPSGPRDEPSAAPAATVTVTRAFLGSPQYMAPEQIQSARDVDGRADVWALGVILYELVSGRRPFVGDTLSELCEAIVHREPAPFFAASEAEGEVDGALAAVLVACLAKDRAKRCPSIPAFAAAIVGLGSGEGRASFERIVRTSESVGRSSSSSGLGPRRRSGSSSAPGTKTRRGRSLRLVTLASVGALALVAGAASLALRHPASRAPAPGPKARTGCASNRACAESHGGAPYACRASDGACVPMASPDCEALFEPRDLVSDDALWLGAMFPTKGPAAAAFGTMNRLGIDLARKEIADATASLEGSQRVRPIALVACDDSEDPGRAARHLVDDVGVPAIVGFRSGQEVIELAGSLLVPRGVVTVATLTSSPLITRLPQPPGPRLVWRTTFSLDAVADAAAGMIHDVLEPRAASRGRGARIALARIDMPAGLSFAERLYKQLVFNGKPATDNGHDYQELVFPPTASDDDVARTAEALVKMRATIVLLLGDDTTTVPIVRRAEAQWPAGEPRPTYVVANDSTELFTDYLGTSVDRRRRLFAIESLSNSTEGARFVIRYNQTHRDQVTRTINPGVSYDAIYLLAYAAFAAKEPSVSGASLARSFGRLVPPGRPITTGPMQIFEAISALAAGEAIDLHGTESALDFDLSTGEAPSDFALLCPNVDAAGRAAGEDVESGVVYRARNGRVEGTLRCP